jgi:hypothetical protein
MTDIESMAVTVPEGISGDVEIRRILTGPPSLWSMFHGPSRMVPEGQKYTVLYRNGALWMSDTPAERADHLPAIRMAKNLQAQRCLVNGLGLGMVVSGLLAIEEVRHIDVVEIDVDVIRLVAEHYQEMAAKLGKTVTVHQGDAFNIRWPVGTRWDIGWSDIWKDAKISNLAEMERLNRRYASRLNWHGHWLRDFLKSQQRMHQRSENRLLRYSGEHIW